MLCFLEGSIHQSNYGALIDRLKISSLSDPIPFKMREVCVTKQSGKTTEELRLRQIFNDSDEGYWIIRRLKPIRSEYDLPTQCKTIQEFPSSDGIENFMEKLGFSHKFEFVQEGLRFVIPLSNGIANMYISKIKNIHEKGKMDQLTDLIPDSYFVELQSLVDEKTVLSGSQELSNLAGSFYPLVDLKK